MMFYIDDDDMEYDTQVGLHLCKVCEILLVQYNWDLEKRNRQIRCCMGYHLLS